MKSESALTNRRSRSVLACAETIKKRIWQDCELKVEISPMPVLNMLTVNCPDSASLSKIRNCVHGACEQVESVSEDHAVFAVEGSFQTEGVP